MRSNEESSPKSGWQENSIFYHAKDTVTGNTVSVNGRQVKRWWSVKVKENEISRGITR